MVNNRDEIEKEKEKTRIIDKINKMWENETLSPLEKLKMLSDIKELEHIK